MGRHRGLAPRTDHRWCLGQRSCPFVPSPLPCGPRRKTHHATELHRHWMHRDRPLHVRVFGDVDARPIADRPAVRLTPLGVAGGDAARLRWLLHCSRHGGQPLGDLGHRGQLHGLKEERGGDEQEQHGHPEPRVRQPEEPVREQRDHHGQHGSQAGQPHWWPSSPGGRF
jgi:hypothetical protein